MTTVGIIAPLLIVFAVGIGARRLGWLTSDDGGVLLRLVFYVGAPALIFLAISRAQIGAQQLSLLLLPVFVYAIALAAFFLVRRSLLTAVASATLGTICTAIILNSGFLIPFVQRYAGDEGIARLALIDVSTGVLTYTVIYLLAVRFGNADASWSFVAQRLLISPPLWGLIAAVLVRVTGVATPAVIIDTLTTLAAFVPPVILLALGLKFRWVRVDARPLLASLFLRFGIGVTAGVVFVELFDLEGVDRAVALLCAMAPIGYNSITFSELENLDVDLAATQVSTGIVVGLVLVSTMLALYPL